MWFLFEILHFWHLDWVNNMTGIWINVYWLTLIKYFKFKSVFWNEGETELELIKWFNKIKYDWEFFDTKGKNLE